jgi:hypothetical protein
VVKHALKEMEGLEDVRWVERFEEKKKLRLEKLEKKQAGELQALRLKL